MRIPAHYTMLVGPGSTVLKKIAAQGDAFAEIIMIITLFESQIILAEHECCTNWGDCKSKKKINSNVGI